MQDLPPSDTEPATPTAKPAAAPVTPAASTTAAAPNAARSVRLPTDAPAVGRRQDATTKPTNGHHRTRRPLIEWWGYVIAIGTAVVLLAGPFIQEALQTDVSRISLVIFALFLAAVVKNFLDVRFLARQSRLAIVQVAQLRETNNIAKFLAEADDSLLRDHIANLYEVFRRDVNISQDNLVTLLQTRLLSRTRIVDFCSSALVTLGLVGTIIGLIAASGGLTDVFTAAGGGQDADLVAAMKDTFAGMGIAFYTTLLGAILGGVFLRLLANLVDANIDHIVSHIAELTEVYILPILRRAARINEEHQKHQRQEALDRGESIVDF